MKSLLDKLGILLFGLLILGNAEVWGAQWTEYAYREIKGVKIAIHLYDSESMMVDKHPGEPPQKIVKVWVKTIYTEAHIEQTKKEYPGATVTHDETPKLLEINCKTKMYRILQGRVYDPDTDKIKELPTKWLYFSPDSGYRVLYERLCLGK